MLIKCPKCNFEQPEDVFCAKCGIHIPSFHAPEPSLQNKALRSSSFYVFLLICLAIGSSFYFYNNWNNYDRSGQRYALEDLKSWLLNEPQVDDLEQEELSSEDELSEANDQPKIENKAKNSNKDQEAGQALKSNLEIDLKTAQLNIAFYEIKNDVLSKYSELFDIKYQDQDTVSFLINKTLVAKEIMDSSNLIISKLYPLDLGNSRRFEEVDENKKILYFGYNLSLSPELAENKTSLAGSITLLFQDLNTVSDENSNIIQFQQDFFIEKDVYLFIKGFIPQNVVNDEEKQFLAENANVLSIYASDDYKNSESDFVTIIHLTNTASNN